MKGLQKLQIAIGGMFSLISIVTVVYQITCSYMGIAAMWTDDVSMYSFIWAVFMGVAAMVHSNANFAFTSMIASIKRNSTWLCIPICGATSSIYLIYGTCALVMKLFNGGNF